METIIDYHLDNNHITNKPFICIIYTVDGDFDKCYEALLFDLKQKIDHPNNILASFPYSKRNELSAKYHCEPFFNKDLECKATTQEVIEFLKLMIK